MSISNNIWRGTIFVSAASVVGQAGSFLGNIAIVRILGKDQVGLLVLIESWLLIATMFSLLGISAASVKYISQYLDGDVERVGGIMGAALGLAGIISLVVASVTYYFLISGFSLISPTIRELLGQHVFILVGLIIIVTYREIAVGFVYGLQEFRILLKLNVVTGLINFPVSYLLVQWNGLAGALEARLALTCIEIVVLSYYLRKILMAAGIRLSFGEAWENIRHLLGFGFATLIGQLPTNPIQTLLKSLLAIQPQGLSQLGLYTTASRLSALAGFLPGSMASTLIPVLSREWGRGDKASFGEAIFLALRMFWLITLPLVLFFLAASPTLLEWLYGGEFREAWPVAFVLLLITLLVNMNETADRALASSGYVWLSSFNNYLGAGLTVLSAMVLVPLYLAFGYASAFLLAYSLYIPIQLWWLRRLFFVRLRPLLSMLLISPGFVGIALMIAIASTGDFTRLILAVILAVGALMIEWHFFITESEKTKMLKRLKNTHLSASGFLRRFLGRVTG